MPTGTHPCACAHDEVRPRGRRPVAMAISAPAPVYQAAPADLVPSLVATVSRVPREHWGCRCLVFTVMPFLNGSPNRGLSPSDRGDGPAHRPLELADDEHGQFCLAQNRRGHRLREQPLHPTARVGADHDDVDVMLTRCGIDRVRSVAGIGEDHRMWHTRLGCNRLRQVLGVLDPTAGGVLRPRARDRQWEGADHSSSRHCDGVDGSVLKSVNTPEDGHVAGDVDHQVVCVFAKQAMRRIGCGNRGLGTVDSNEDLHGLVIPAMCLVQTDSVERGARAGFETFPTTVTPMRGTGSTPEIRSFAGTLALVALAGFGGAATVLSIDRAGAVARERDVQLVELVSERVSSRLTSSVSSLRGADGLAVDGRIDEVEFRALFEGLLTDSVFAVMTYAEVVPESVTEMAT